MSVSSGGEGAAAGDQGGGGERLLLSAQNIHNKVRRTSMFGCTNFGLNVKQKRMSKTKKNIAPLFSSVLFFNILKFSVVK